MRVRGHPPKPPWQGQGLCTLTPTPKSGPGVPPSLSKSQSPHTHREIPQQGSDLCRKATETARPSAGVKAPLKCSEQGSKSHPNTLQALSKGQSSPPNTSQPYSKDQYPLSPKHPQPVSKGQPSPNTPSPSARAKAPLKCSPARVRAPPNTPQPLTKAQSPPQEPPNTSARVNTPLKRSLARANPPQTPPDPQREPNPPPNTSARVSNPPQTPPSPSARTKAPPPQTPPAPQREPKRPPNTPQAPFIKDHPHTPLRDSQTPPTKPPTRTDALSPAPAPRMRVALPSPHTARSFRCGRFRFRDAGRRDGAAVEG